MTSNIHDAMGDTIFNVAFQITRHDPYFKLWYKANVPGERGHTREDLPMREVVGELTVRYQRRIA